MKIETSRHWQTGWDDYESRLAALIDSFDKPDILELGGGGRPMWDLADVPAGVGTYTVNDFDQRELDKIDDGYHKACFDVCGDASAFAGRYDLVFSRFLAEHVPDGVAMHRNVRQVLKPGGVAIHLIPKLYASPFVVNTVLPAKLTHKMLTAFFPYRMEGKFPTHYSLCKGSTSDMRRALEEIGYSKVEVADYYGHLYYDRIPGLRQVEEGFSALAARRRWSWYSSYAVIVAFK